jgi:integrase/recombinase XerD
MTSDKALTVSAPRDIEPGADVRALVDDWHKGLDLQVKAGDLAATTATTYRAGVKRFLAWAVDQGSVTDDTIREWKGALLADGRKPGTVNTWLAGVRAFFAWAVGARRLPHNPAASVKGARRKGTSQKHKRSDLTNDEVRRVLAATDRTTAAGKRDCAILALMAYTAARTVELHRADLDDLATEAGQLVLHVRGKGHVEADDLIVIAHPQAANALHDWLSVRGDRAGALFTSLSDRSRGKRMSLQAYRAMWLHAKKTAGVRDKAGTKTLHSLRHTAISNAVRHGAPVQKVQAMARHANIQTTMIYYHEADRIENPAERFISYDTDTR